MKRTLLLLFALPLWFLSAAQEQPEKDQLPTYGKVGTFIHKFSIGLPMLNFDFCYHIKNKGLISLPDGQGQYFYNTKPSLGLFVPGHDGSIRFLGLFYNDRWGVEYYYATYGIKSNTNAYAGYLTDHLSNYYITAPKYDAEKWFRYYAGALYGITYMFHVKKYVVTPKFLMGFRSAGTAYTDEYSFKEKGNNRWLAYTVKRELLDNFQSSFHLQLNIARHFYGTSPYIKRELGLKLEYMYIPYHVKVTTTTKPFDGTETERSFDYRNSYNMISIGAYYSLYVVKKHAVPVKKKK